MKARLILGTLFISILILSLWIDSRLEFAYASFTLLLLLGIGGAIEFSRIMKNNGAAAYSALLIAAAVLYPLKECLRIKLGWGVEGRSDLIFIFVFVMCVLGRAILAGHVTDGLDRAARTVFCFILLYLFYCLAPVLLEKEAYGGLGAAYALVLTSKSCDIGAYLIGRTFGKRKLIPKVSPGKTIAGGVGGISFAVAAGILSFWLLDKSLALGIIFGGVLGIVTMLSDLAESLVKRCAKVKDSASLLPEMGGVLDVIDSLILAAPTGLILLSIL